MRHSVWLVPDAKKGEREEMEGERRRRKSSARLNQFARSSDTGCAVQHGRPKFDYQLINRLVDAHLQIDPFAAAATAAAVTTDDGK